MQCNIDKEIYIRIVRHTLQFMSDLAKEDTLYNLQADTLHYFHSTIVPERILTKEEFLMLCEEAGIPHII